MLLHRSLRTIAQRVRSVLRKYGTNAHMYIAGVGPVKGFTPGNYVESTGVTPATVDQPVGLVKDAANVTGGINASQSTSGYRPVERRGIVNLLLNNKWDGGGTAPTGWVAVGNGGAQGSVLPNGCYARTFAPVASRDYIYESFAAASNTTYTIAVYVGANTAIQTQEAVLAVGLPAGASVALRNPTSVVSNGFIFADLVTSATAGSFTLRVGAGCSSTVTGSITLSQPAIFQGTLTSSQILAMGGIPMTTTAAASSAMGPYYLEHKAASTQFLTLGSNPIGATLTQPYTIVVAGIVGSLGTDRYMCGDLARAVGVSNNGLAFVVHGGNFSSGMSAGIAAGSTIVVEVTYDGSLLNVWINGVKKLTNFSLAASGSAAQPFALGQRGNNTGYWDGGLYPSFVTNSVLPDADRRLIAKQIAQLAGVTL